MYGVYIAKIADKTDAIREDRELRDILELGLFVFP